MILNISNPLHTLHVGHALDTQAGAPLVRADLAGPEGIEAAFGTLQSAGAGAILIPTDEVLAKNAIR